jgi:predicted nucleic acid-binding protein
MLIDTSGWLCLFHAAERQHNVATTYFDAAQFKATTSYVLAEFVALALVRGLPRRQTHAFITDIQDGSEVTVIYCDEVLHRRALTLLGRRLDKTWSLCDAVSMEVMDEYKIREALTTDHHFEQAGYIRLLQP